VFAIAVEVQVLLPVFCCHPVEPALSEVEWGSAFAVALAFALVFVLAFAL
jgi:hypothetical protein